MAAGLYAFGRVQIAHKWTGQVTWGGEKVKVGWKTWYHTLNLYLYCFHTWYQIINLYLLHITPNIKLHQIEAYVNKCWWVEYDVGTHHLPLFFQIFNIKDNYLGYQLMNMYSLSAIMSLLYLFITFAGKMLYLSIIAYIFIQNVLAQ